MRRVDPVALDAHGAPLPAVAGPVGALLPGKAMELDTGQWQLALDPGCWPVRQGDRVLAEDGGEWVVVYAKFIPSPPLAAEEGDAGVDLDVAFIRVTGNQVTPAGTEPTDGLFVGRVGYP